MARTEPARLRWRKSSHSGGGNDCVELAGIRGGVAVRDSKNPNGPALTFGPAEWGAFLKAVKTTAN